MNYLSFKEFNDIYGLEDQATSNINIKEVLDQLTTPAGIYMRDDKVTTTAGIVNLHPTEGTHWVLYTNKNHFVSFGCPPPVNITKQIIGGIHSEYQIQKDDSYLAADCLYVLYLTQIIGFKNTVLNLYYQTFILIK